MRLLTTLALTLAVSALAACGGGDDAAAPTATAATTREATAPPSTRTVAPIASATAPAAVPSATSAPIVAPTPTPPAPPPPVDTPTAATQTVSLRIAAQDIAYDRDALAAPAGATITVTFDNRDEGIAHNFSVYAGADNTAPGVAETSIDTGAVVQTLTFGPLSAGSYYFQCDVHTQMNGTLTVQ